MNEEKPCVWTDQDGDATSNPSTCYRAGKRNGLWEFRFADGGKALGHLTDNRPDSEWEWQLTVSNEQHTLHSHYIDGPWETGIIMDNYIVRSIYTGDDESGKPTFDTEYTALGGLLNSFKYKEDKTAVDKLLPFARVFLSRHKKIFDNIDIIAPIPSPSGKTVTLQLAHGLSEFLGGVVSTEAITTRNTESVKNMTVNQKKKVLAETTDASSKILSGKTVLLVDDLFASGATVEAAAEATRKQGNAAVVYMFTFAKTKHKALVNDPDDGTPFDESILDGDFDDDIPF